MRIFAVLLLISAAMLAPLSHAQSSSSPSASAPAPAAGKEMAEAEVRRVDKESKKVSLKHGPIKSLDMPAMTMVFQVRDEKLFEKLVPGQKILFSAEQLQGAYVITAVEKPAK
jgi:Cu(I)/Ag(I) efflux system periplasmic protein CusF